MSGKHNLAGCLIWSSRQANDRSDLGLPLLDLIQSPAIFPFELTSHLVTLQRSTHFEISRQGLDLEMITPVKGLPIIT